jgi:hypothetical protein
MDASFEKMMYSFPMENKEAADRHVESYNG